jgi:hypothetical protein
MAVSTTPITTAAVTMPRFMRSYPLVG